MNEKQQGKENKNVDSSFPFYSDTVDARALPDHGMIRRTETGFGISVILTMDKLIFIDSV